MRPGLMICVSLAFAPALAQVASPTGTAREWVLLGARAVNDRADHDVIVVTGAKGDFKGVKLTVQRAAVDFHKVVVHFANGTKQELELRNTVPAGGETRIIDLTGNERFINRVEFWYDAKTIRGRRAVVRLFGLR